MIQGNKATSIVESMIIMLIVVTGVVGMYRIYTESTKLSNTTANKIQAIQIAREGIEAMTNIRDTNWIVYGSDYQNCWNTLNYNASCVGSTDTTHDIIPGSYRINQNSSTKKWELSKYTAGPYSNSTYRTDFAVSRNSNGLYIQNGSTNTTGVKFTREIQISYEETDSPSNGADSNDEKMKVTSLVQWVDNASTAPHKVELETILTNWKHKK